MLKWRPDTDALAAAFTDNVAAGLRGEGAGDEVLEAAAGTDDDRRSEPVERPDGSKCYTEDCERHKEENFTIPKIKEAKNNLNNAFLSIKNKTALKDNIILLKRVNKKIVKKVKELCGRDIGKYIHSVSIRELQHAINRHPNLTPNDMKFLFDIIDNWDDLKYTYKDNIPRLEYHKNHKGKKYIVVERIGRKRRNPKDLHSLQFTTIYW